MTPARIKFLISLASAIKNGSVKKISQAVAFARQQFGKVDDNFLNDIINVFKKEGKTKKGDVVPIKKQKGIMATDEATEIVKKRTKDIIKGDPTGEVQKSIDNYVDENFGDLLDELEKMGDKTKSIKKAANELKKIADDTKPFMTIAEGPQKGKKITIDDFFAMTGKARDPRTGVVSAAAREILNKNKVNIGREDPINVLRQMYGEKGLEAVDAVSDSLLDAQNYGEMNTILTQNKLFDLVPKKTYGYDQNVVSAEKIRKSKEEHERLSKILDDYDVRDRDPNAEGGLINILKL